MSRCSGFTVPFASRAGTKRRSKSSRIERAADRAARSAARCARDAPLTAPPNAAITSAHAMSATSDPSTRGSAWPVSAAIPRARRWLRRPAAPPGSTPASALRVATRPGARVARRTAIPSSRSSRASSDASGRCRGRSARITAVTGPRTAVSIPRSCSAAVSTTTKRAPPATAAAVMAGTASDQFGSSTVTHATRPRAAAL